MMRPERALSDGRRVRRHRGERGAALTETVVLLVVLVPLMFAVPMIGKLVDLRQTTVQAGRYATWQATVSHGEALPAQIGPRFFGLADASLATESVVPGTNVLWGASQARSAARPVAGHGPDVAGWPAHADLRIDAATIVASPWSTGHGELGIAGAVGNAIQTAGKALGGSRWDLATTSLTRAEIGVDIRSNGWFEEQAIDCGGAMGGCMREAGVILVDGWSSDSDTTTVDRVKALVPASHLQAVGDLISNLGAVPLLRELRGMDGMFGYVDTRPLPAHADHGLQTYEEP